MKKIILASASAIALLGLAACSDTDGTTTQSTEPAMDTMQTPAPAPDAAPVEPVTPEVDDTTTQGIDDIETPADETEVLPSDELDDTSDDLPPAPAQ